MKIACIGGGPAGLYLGILVKRGAPGHDVVIYERNGATETFGFGVVFSDATLGHLAEADPETHAQITARFARWDAIETHVGGAVLRSTGHGFCGIERKELLAILQARATALGVRIVYEHGITLAELQAAGTADVIVACDGVGSVTRDALADRVHPTVDVRPNKFVWLGCTVPYDAFTFLFEATEYGLFRVHAYRYSAQGSTFIVECREDTWRAAGLDRANEDATVEILERIFAAHLRGHRLVKNRSIWRNFPTVRCASWHADHVVLLGDAAHTAHFSIGSGTKLAMEDAIALRDALLAHPTVPAALAAYEAARRPEVEALQAAAQASLEWFEGTERYLGMAPVQFTYSLMTRSLRVSHASMQKRDPALAHGVEALLAAALDVPAATAPSQLPFALGAFETRTRLVTQRGDTLVDSTGAIAATLLPSHATVMPAGAVIFDAGELATARSQRALEALPAAIAAACAADPDRLVGAVVRDRPGTRHAVMGHAAQLVRAGAALLLVEAPEADADARLPAASLADRLRNELHVATLIAAHAARTTEIDAAIAAGRVDLVITKAP